MKTLKTTVKAFPHSRETDEIMAHSLVAHLFAEKKFVRCRAAARGYLWTQLAASKFSTFGDEHLKLVEQALHLDDPTMSYDDAGFARRAAEEEKRSFLFHYLLAKGVEGLECCAFPFNDSIRSCAQARLSELVSDPDELIGQLLAYTSFEEDLQYNNAFGSQGFQAAIIALLNLLGEHGFGECWKPTEAFQVPTNMRVEISRGYINVGNKNVPMLYVSVNDVRVLTVDTRKTYVLWTKLDMNRAFAHIKAHGRVYA